MSGASPAIFLALAGQGVCVDHREMNRFSSEISRTGGGALG
jgi:hypothetical protein